MAPDKSKSAVGFVERVNSAIEWYATGIRLPRFLFGGPRERKEDWWLSDFLKRIKARKWLRSYFLYVIWTLFAYYFASMMFYALIGAQLNDSNFGIANVVFMVIHFCILFFYFAMYFVVSLVYRTYDHQVLRNVVSLSHIHQGLLFLFGSMVVIQSLNTWKYGLVQDIEHDGSPAAVAAMSTSFKMTVASGVGMLISVLGSNTFIRTRDRMAVVVAAYQERSRTILDGIS